MDMTGGEGALTGGIIGGHQVGQLIGASALAEVYETRHPALEQPMALKVFAPGISAHTTYIETMRDTAASAQRLRAAHILPIYDFARAGDHIYVSMPLMRESLRALLQRTPPLPPADAVALLRQITAGLAPAHAAGIIHRDLKPENVLLDAHGHVFISDFGVGRDLPPRGALGAAPDTLSSLIGSPAYMAPEQLRGLPTDQRSDVYALGIILYEMLTGAPPFSGATIYEVAAQALTTPIPPFAQRGASMSPLLERAILRALARDPAGRWPTAQRFIVGVDTALPTQPGSPAAPLSSDANDEAPDQPARPQDPRITRPLPALGADALPVASDPFEIADEVVLSDQSLGGTSTGVMRDLRLFRVDPLPPLPARRRPTGLLLVGVVFLLLGVLAAGGALLAHAAQTSQGNPVATPTSTPVSLPTQFIIDPMQTAQPISTAKPTALPTRPPAPRPTATPKPQPTATPAPQATVTPTPAPKPTTVPQP
jgi:serine/threonine protein kinase